MLHPQSMPALQTERGFADGHTRGQQSCRCFTYFTTTLAIVAWTLYAGKDLNWDALNYHLYAGFSALNDRFNQDFFPAGAASYFNPLAHVPLYLMVKVGVPAIGIGATLAVLHSLSLWLTYELALTLIRDAKPLVQQGIAWLAVALAALNPVFLQAAGSTFSDLTTGLFVLGGWLALMQSFRDRTLTAVLVGGTLLGSAAALKLSNAIFAVAAMPMLLMLPGSIGGRLRRLTVFGASASVVFIAVAAPWAWKLWQHFGNPFFPLFNAWFESPDFITEPLKHTRFIPESWASAAFQPFRMAIPERMIHTEPRAPDVRYATLFVGLVVWAGIALAQRCRPNQGSGRVAVARNAMLAGLTLSFVLAWILWTAMSGNSRYFMPMGCIAAVALAAVLHKLMRRPRLFAYLAAVVVIVQLTQVALGAQLRWTENRWTGPWFRLVVPERFKSEPYLYLSLDVQSGSFLAPFVAADSGFMNVSGSYVLGPDKPGGERAQRLIRQNDHRLRSLLPIQRVDSDGRPLPPATDVLNDRVRRFGLEVDAGDCVYFELDGGLDLLVYTGSGPAPSERPRTTYFMTCKLMPSPRDTSGYRAEELRANAIFDNVEDTCPNLFHPRRTVAVKKSAWTRHYVLGTDLQVWIFDGWVKYSNPVVGGEPIVIGRASDWERGPQAMDCSKKRGVGFEGILP